MRFLTAMIGYAAVATVLSALLGLGYLWQTERLTDDRMFRIVALLHGVDLTEAIEDEQPIETIPDEELSLAEKDRLVEIKTRNHEAHLFSLQRGRNEFEHALSQLVSERDRFDQLAREMEQRLKEESAETANEGVKNVVRDLTLAKPDKAKEMLLLMLNRGGNDPEEKQRALDDVIRLINSMPRDTWEGIQNKFEGQAELNQLHVIQLEQLGGGAKRSLFDEALQELQSRK